MKEQIIAKSVEIPADFQQEERLNITELAKQAEAAVNVLKTITKYTDTFIDQFKMSANEVIKFIPESQYKKYKLCPELFEFFKIQEKIVVDSFIQTLCIKYLEEKHHNNKYAYLYLRLSEMDLSDAIYVLNMVFDDKKVFLVDTKNKHIHLIEFDNERDIDITNSQKVNENYTGVILSVDTRIIYRTFSKQYNGFGYKEAQGTAYINITHEFCMLTNTYKGTTKGTQSAVRKQLENMCYTQRNGFRHSNNSRYDNY